MTNFEFKLNTNSYFGHGITDALPEKLKEFGFRRPGIVIDEAVYGTEAAKKLMARFDASALAVQCVLKSRSDREPDYDYLDLCADEIKKYDVDCLVGIGGGSAMDLCKGIAVLKSNSGKGIMYRGMNKVKNSSIPVVLIPTTAGTGSEATFTAVFVDRESKTKLGINGQNVGAYAAFIDSDFTASCPKGVAVGAGLDAMVHAFESFMTTEKNPVIWRIAIQSWAILFKSFEKAVNQPHERAARLNMLLGSYLAGITLMYSGGGIAGSLSYPLGAEYGVPHGIAGGVFLKHIIEMNIRSGYRGYNVLYDEMEPNDCMADPSEKSERFFEKVSLLISSIGAPAGLSEYGIKRTDVLNIAKSTIEKRGAVLERNPIRFDKGKITELLEKVVGG